MQESISTLDPPLYSFDGVTFSYAADCERLSTQLQAVKSLMLDGEFRTLREIADALSIPEASASARIRDLRKARFGGYRVERRRRGAETRGLHEYRVSGGAA